MFCLNLMRIALELAQGEPVYEALATKFFQHYVYIGARDEADGRPRLRAVGRATTASSTTCCATPDGRYHKFRVRSLVGLIPLFAVERLEAAWIEHFEEFRANLDWFLQNRPDLVGLSCYHGERGRPALHVLSIVDQDQLARILAPDLGRGRVPVARGHPQPLEVSRGAPVHVRRRRR